MITEVLISEMLCAASFVAANGDDEEARNDQAHAQAQGQPQPQAQVQPQPEPQAQPQPLAQQALMAGVGGIVDLDARGGQWQVELKPFQPPINGGPEYQPVVEVACKAHLMPEMDCVVGMRIPTSGIYQGHQCGKCNHFYHNICTGDGACSNAWVGM